MRVVTVVLLLLVTIVHVCLRVLLTKACCCAFGQFFQLLGSVVEAAQVRGKAGSEVGFNRIAAADAVKATDLLLVSFESKQIVIRKVEVWYLHSLHVKHSEGVLQQSDLSVIVLGRVRRHRGTGIDFNEPRLQLVVKQNIKSVQLEAVLVVDDGFLH